MKKSVEVAFKKEFEGWQDTPSSERNVGCWKDNFSHGFGKKDTD